MFLVNAIIQKIKQYNPKKEKRKTNSVNKKL